MASLHVSVSQIKEYVRCPRHYFLHRVVGVEPAFIPIALAFGSAFHAALSFFYGMLKETGAVPAVDETIAIFWDAWRNSGDGPVPLQATEDDDEAPADLEAKGAAMLTAFQAAPATRAGIVDAVEQDFSIELHDPDTGEVLEERLVGAFDLVLREADRRVIVEHKSSARRYSEDQLKFDIQPTAYRLAAREIGHGEVGLKYQIVTKTKVPTVQIVDVQRDAHAEDDFLRTVVGVLRAIDAGAFYPLRGWQYRGCQYAYACNTQR